MNQREDACEGDPAADPVGEVLERMLRKEVTPRRAVSQLIDLGVEKGDASETVFFAIGGSDLIETGADGQERCQPSGRLVSELAREMKR